MVRLRSFLLLVLGLLVLLLLVEGVGRLFVYVGPARAVDADGHKIVLLDYSGPFPRPCPDLDGWLVAGEFEVRLRTDEEGRRVAPGRAAERLEGDPTLELLVVGDSVAFGWGVEYQDTFGWQLRKLLSEELSAGGQVRIKLTNLATPATGLRSQRLRLADYLESRDASIPAVFSWTLLVDDGFGGGNDLLDTLRSVRRDEVGAAASSAELESGQETRAKRSGTPLAYAAKKWLSRHSVFYELTMRAIGPAIRRLAPAPDRSAPRYQAQLDEAWQVFGDELLETQEVLERHGILGAFGYVPYLYVANEKDRRTEARLGQAMPPGSVLVSFLDAMHEHQREFSYPRDGHPRAFGHKAMAEAFLASVAVAARGSIDAVPAQPETRSE